MSTTASNTTASKFFHATLDALMVPFKLKLAAYNAIVQFLVIILCCALAVFILLCTFTLTLFELIFNAIVLLVVVLMIFIEAFPVQLGVLIHDYLAHLLYLRPRSTI